MSHQPFRLVQPLSRILHTTLVQRIGEVNLSFTLADLDALYTYAFMDHVKHMEVCEALQRRATEVHKRGDAVLSSSDLLFPFGLARRAINAVQHFPNTTAEEEAAKAATELAIVHDLTRLSTDDLSPKDVGSLWSSTIQLSSWNSVQEVLRHFPLQQTLAVQDDREFRELVQWVCLCNAASPVAGSAADVPHAKLFFSEVLRVEEVLARCRSALGGTSASYVSSRGDLSSEERQREERETSALLFVSLATTLRRQCGMISDFPLSEAEWVQCTAPSSSSSSPVSSSNAGGGGAVRLSAAKMSFAAWSRRLTFVHDPAIPLYVQQTFQRVFTSDLRRLYHQRDVYAVGLFYLVVFPLSCRTAAPGVDMRQVVRDYHKRVVQDMFWTVSRSTTSGTTSTSSSSSAAAAAPTGKRGRWTSSHLAESGKQAQSDSPAPAAVSLFISADVSLAVLLGEISVMAENEALAEMQVPAITTMLRTVLTHLRTHMSVDGMGRRASNSNNKAQLPLSLWAVWHPVQSSYLAVVLSGLLRASALQRNRTSGGSSSSDSGAAASASVSTCELDSLVAEGLEALRRLLDVRVLRERGTGAVLTTLLTNGYDAVLAMGGAAYEGQLRAMVLENIMNGFTREGLQGIAEVALRHCAKESEVDQERTRNFVRQLDQAQLQLPHRSWV